MQFEKVTQIPLEGEGTINKRVEKWVATPAPPCLPGLSQIIEITDRFSFNFLQIVYEFVGESRLDKRPPRCGRHSGGNAFSRLHRVNSFTRSTNS